jgi:hypothetical protein
MLAFLGTGKRQLIPEKHLTELELLNKKFDVP